jgi:hypothetical protein
VGVCFLLVCVSAPQTQLANGMSTNNAGDRRIVKIDQVICIPSSVPSIADMLPCASLVSLFSSTTFTASKGTKASVEEIATN